MQKTSLIMRQRNAMNAFSFDFLSTTDREINLTRPLGSFEFALFSQAQNARLSHHEKGSKKGDVAVTMGTDSYRMIHTYTKRAYFNDVLYQLVCEADGSEVARIELTRIKGKRWPSLIFTVNGLVPNENNLMQLDIFGNFLRRHFVLRRWSDQMEVGRISDISSAFSFRRMVLIETQGLSTAQQALLGIFVSFFRP